MKNNLQNIQQMDLNIEIEPSFVLVPENGVYNEYIYFNFIFLNSNQLIIKQKKKGIQNQFGLILVIFHLNLNKSLKQLMTKQRMKKTFMMLIQKMIRKQFMMN